MQNQLIFSGILLLTLICQALIPTRRVLIVTVGAGAARLASTLLHLAPTTRLLAEVPWDVLVILVTLGLLSQVFAASRVFDRLAVTATRRSRADPRRITLVFAVAMYVVSGVVNNLTALVLVLPVLHVLLRLAGTRQRYVSWTLGVVLVACNLGGAATPIGDFPAILLLGRGSMTFTAYLVRAAPATMVALALLLAVCAGSSLFLTAATSGPLAQALTERAGLLDVEGRPLRFGFFEFLPIGLLSFAVILATAFSYAGLSLLFAG